MDKRQSAYNALSVRWYSIGKHEVNEYKRLCCVGYLSQSTQFFGNVHKTVGERNQTTKEQEKRPQAQGLSA